MEEQYQQYPQTQNTQSESGNGIGASGVLTTVGGLGAAGYMHRRVNKLTKQIDDAQNQRRALLKQKSNYVSQYNKANKYHDIAQKMVGSKIINPKIVNETIAHHGNNMATAFHNINQTQQKVNNLKKNILNMHTDKASSKLLMKGGGALALLGAGKMIYDKFHEN